MSDTWRGDSKKYWARQQAKRQNRRQEKQGLLKPKPKRKDEREREAA